MTIYTCKDNIPRCDAYLIRVFVSIISNISLTGKYLEIDYLVQKAIQWELDYFVRLKTAAVSIPS